MTEMAHEHTWTQSIGEEVANSVSHGVGLAAALVGVPFLIVAAARHGDAGNIIGHSVFGATVVLLYLASTLYHAMPRSRAKHFFRLVDHGAIFLLIAGTYTAFTLGILRGAWGWTLFGLVWALAAIGMTLKLTVRTRHPVLSTCLYLAMGWLVLIAAQPIWLGVPHMGVLWLALGGVAYTVGVAFYAATKVPYSHAVWHLFVLSGTACHYIAVLGYAAA